MANLVITYDLPSRNYEAVEKVIDGMGGWARVATTTFVVSTSLSAAQARDRIIQAMGPSDRLFVADATNNASAWWNQLQDVADWLQKHWS